MLKAYLSNREELRELQEQVTALRETSAEADRQYAGIKAAYYNSKYGLIARELTEGTPCPVCGSAVHPAPARMPEVSATEE